MEGGVTFDGIANVGRLALEFFQGGLGGVFMLLALVGALGWLVIRGKRKEADARAAEIAALNERVDKCETRHQECEERVKRSDERAGKVGLALYHLLHDPRRTAAKRMAKEAIQDLLEPGV